MNGDRDTYSNLLGGDPLLLSFVWKLSSLV